MATLTIREVDDNLLNRISDLASRNRLSVEDQIKEILENSVQTAFMMISKPESARHIAAMTPKNVQQTDSTRLLRKDRSR